MPRSNYAARLSEFADRLVFGDAPSFGRIRGRWATRFRDQIGEGFGGRVVLEIGCADATFLAAVAARHPQTAFIGLDWKCKAIYDAAQRVEEAGLRNVLFVRGRAQDLPVLFADGELDEIWVFHPDPCDRDVELPNRLFSAPFLLTANAALRGAGSRLTLKTDHADYFSSALSLFADEASQAARLFGIERQSVDFWNDADAQGFVAGRPFAGMATPYEQRFRGKRKPIFFIDLAKRA